MKYRPPPVRTVHLWNASLAARHAAEARWRAAPRAWGVGCLSNVPGQYRPLLFVARTPPLLRTAACRRAPRAWLTPSPFSSSLSNDARNMVVARRRLFPHGTVSLRSPAASYPMGWRATATARSEPTTPRTRVREPPGLFSKEAATGGSPSPSPTIPQACSATLQSCGGPGPPAFAMALAASSSRAATPASA